METDRFDQLALLIGTARSRREVIRLLAAGAVSAVVSARFPRAVAAALCPERVPKPGYTPTANGCGPDGYDWFVPDNWKQASFTSACKKHDLCYGTCNRNRFECDYAMLQRMRAACKRAYSPNGTRKERKLYRRCLKVVNFYYSNVDAGGQAAYEDAQEEACLCCDQDGRGPKCGDRCCFQGFSCLDAANSTCCWSDSTLCGDGCCPTKNGCYECVGGECRYKCKGYDYCDRNGVCQNCDPSTGCGG